MNGTRPDGRKQVSILTIDIMISIVFFHHQVFYLPLLKYKEDRVVHGKFR